MGWAVGLAIRATATERTKNRSGARGGMINGQDIGLPSSPVMPVWNEAPSMADDLAVCLCLADDAALVSIGGRVAAFSGKRQRLFEFNETAVWLARRLEAGTRWPALRDKLVDQGLPPVIAGTYARDSLLMWSREGIVAATLVAAPGQEAARQTIEIAGLRRTLCYGTHALMERIAPVFAHLETGDDRGSTCYDIVDGCDLVFIGRRGQPMLIVTPLQAAPSLKGLLIEEILNVPSVSVALHTACLIRDGGALLLAGSPGAGKSTITVALMAAGFGYGGDDIALVDHAGRVQGLRFAPAIKTGAWRLITDLRDDLACARVHHRLDGKRIRFLSPGRGCDGALPVRWIISLQRRKSAPAMLVREDPADALAALIREAYSSRGGASAADIRMLVDLVSGAECHTLVYSELDEAVRTLAGLRGDA